MCDNIFKCLDCGFIFCEDEATVCNWCDSKNITLDVSEDEYDEFLESLNRAEMMEME